MIKYIKNSVQNLSESQKEYNIYNIPVYLLEPFTNNIKMADLLKKIEYLLPQRLLSNIEVIYVASIEDFKRKNRVFNAMYKDGAIYISPIQENETDLLDDILHEIAHSLEKEYQDAIYGDNLLAREFVTKRKTLYYLVDKQTVNILKYISTEYDPEFDKHLYHDLNYDYLRNVAAGLFYSPYAITSLREYWANGFENYLLGDKALLKELSPILYNKVENIFEGYDTEGDSY